MNKLNTNISGLTFSWRHGKTFDALRVFVYQNKKYISISAKVHPTLNQINRFLESGGMRSSQALEDSQFQALFQRIQHELKSEHGLKTYKAIENLNFITKKFNFQNSIEEFFTYKSDVACAHAYKIWIQKFWLPFFISKGCEHPIEFIRWKQQAVTHVRTAKNKSDKKYSHHTYGSLTKSLNEYLRFLKAYEYISEEHFFTIYVKLTLEQQKRGHHANKRSTDTYTEEDLFDIKNKIDRIYAGNPKIKLRAYALYLGICTGLRRGNFLGLKAKHLFPDAKVPYFQLADNIVKAWSRGHKGVLTFENASKMSAFEEGSIQIPLIQPSKSVVVEVANYLKNNLSAEQRLIEAHPDSINRIWEKICKECDFKYLSPLQWRHSYATIGALHLHDWYKGNAYLLQQCCLHSSIKMTEKYINQKSTQLLKAFEET